ncbi:low molecular weight protein-tyrosine-phosphatase [Salinisphaera sp. T5B8]|uniref:low molecular weight protein-tyrosine-phosphatase n=1 Tax=Salinisphaera sp. T5B8 TaxID=1304154 RepID=UPI0033411C44
MQIQSVLCVCTGNICRSPLAEGLIRRDAPAMKVASAGIGAVVGGKMPEAAAAIATREGLALDAHRGQQVTRPMLQAFELVLVMEAAQKDWLCGQFPESRGRVFLTSHWTGGEDIIDPYRLSDDVFESAYAEIEKGVSAWLARLQPATAANHGAG